MKALTILLITICVITAGCSKKSSSSSGTIYKGVVLYSVCCQDVIQTIGPDYLGQPTWTDSNSTSFPVYQHVFKVANACQFGTHNPGDTISFKVIPEQVQNCLCCMVFVYTPSASYPIQVTN